MYCCNIASMYNFMNNPMMYGMNFNSYFPMNNFGAYNFMPFGSLLNSAIGLNNAYTNPFFSNITFQNNFFFNNFFNQSLFTPTRFYPSSSSDNIFYFCLNKPSSRDNYLFVNNGSNSNAGGSRTTGTSNKTYDNTDNAKSSTSWENFKKTNGVKVRTMNGSKVYVCNWTSFSKSQPEWLGMQKYMLEAAEELGLTLIYSDMDRSVSASNAARAVKGNIVAEGGKSPHNYGTACDICLFKDGKPVSAKSDLFRQFANLAKQKSNNQIVWGGDWNKKDEEHHFELRNWKKYQTDTYKIV